MAKERKFVFEDEEGIIESNTYYTRPNRKVLDDNGNEITIEDDIIPFLKRQGFKEVENTEAETIEVTSEVEVSF